MYHASGGKLRQHGKIFSGMRSHKNHTGGLTPRWDGMDQNHYTWEFIRKLLYMTMNFMGCCP